MAKITLRITDMHCATCALNIEQALKRLGGVAGAQVNFAAEIAFIEFDPQKVNAASLVNAIKQAGYSAQEAGGLTLSPGGELQRLKLKVVVSVVLSLALMLIAMGADSGMAFAQFLLASAVLSCGYTIFSRGASSLWRNRRANMDTLVALGVGSAYLYSVAASFNVWLGGGIAKEGHLYYEVAAFLLTFILLGRYLEALTKRRTSQAIQKLAALRPQTALVVREGQERQIPVEELAAGDIVVVKPGGVVPVDGEVIAGYSSVDESLVTGESIPQEKGIGSAVIGGTLNKSGSFRLRATKVGKNTTLSQIIKMVEEAQGSKAPVQELADKVAAIFVPAVFLIALAGFLFWFLLAGKAFAFSLGIFIAVLIIACPCSLGLATPTAVMVATGRAAECGIIIKNAASLQMAQSIDMVVFDKTGTLTVGKPRVTHIKSYIRDETEVLRLAAALENKSEHPLAEAILEYARLHQVSFPEAEGFISLPGKGVKAVVAQAQLALGNRKLMQEEGIDIEKAALDLEQLEGQGRTVMFLARGKQLIGLVAARDELKSHAQRAVQKLKWMGKRVAMVSGDNSRTVQAIAQEAGITEVMAEVLPLEKAGEIKRLRLQGRKAAFVGDGLNDAPALAPADLGIAIGSGTDVAQDAAGIILVKDDLRDVVTAIDLAGFAMRKIKQNLFWAFFYNLIGIPVAAGLF